MPHLAFSARHFQLTSYKGLSRRGAEPRCIRGSAPPKPGELTAAEKRLKKGQRVGRTYLFLPPPCRYVCTFFSAASPTLFKASLFLSHTDCAGSCKLVALEIYSPVAPARILPSRVGTLHWGGSSHNTTEVKIPVSALHHPPQHRNTSPGSTVHVVLDACPKGTCFELKAHPSALTTSTLRAPMHRAQALNATSHCQCFVLIYDLLD